ncbi:hypothetical protein [Kibdelosporangium phytohabitans]|uniref:hypothetical protein n=1 Tax=Kibdelosporangium phytohabitans TaxID=860235 RepID=UPI0012F97074|nr:hypothetical protein [Kibdelosporangium phytohabitans]MBE1461894.1 hypothetical protein [Kibdelosporangium phytohabitans]
MITNAAEEADEPSCHLLEFRVPPGGVRRHHVPAAGSVAGLRKSFDAVDDERL